MSSKVHPVEESPDKAAAAERSGGGRYFITDKHDKFLPPLGSSGMAAAKPETIIDRLRKATDVNRDKPCIRIEADVPPHKKGEKPPPSRPLSEWKIYTFQDIRDQVFEAARAFVQLGVENRSGVALWGFNALQWNVSILGAAHCGGIPAGLYVTDTPEQVRYKLQYTSVSLAVVETVAHCETILGLIDDLPNLKSIVIWAAEGKPIPVNSKVNVVQWSDIPSLAKKVPLKTVTDIAQSIEPGHIFMYTFTSGTTGPPKATLITHDSASFAAKSIVEHTAADSPRIFNGGEERIISYLPMSHIAGTIVDIILPLVVSGNSSGAYVVAQYARPYDLKESTIIERFKVVEPTCFFGVPRVWEKIMEKMQAQVAANPPTGLKLKIAKWSLGKSLEYQMNRQAGGSRRKPFGYGIAEKLILSKVRLALGLSKCKFCLSAAAPLSVEVMKYFGERGININEAYGMTEVGCTLLSTEDHHIWGTIGHSIPGVEMMIRDSNGKELPRATSVDTPEDAAQGEICVRGRCVCAGYLANPDLGDDHVQAMIKKTKDTIDSEGWLHTGDMGVQTKDGLFKITGRYKELIIGAGGENIAPVPIELEIKKLCGAISNIIMIGDKRKFNVALVTLKVQGATGELPGTNKLDILCKPFTSEGVTTVEEAMKDRKLIDAITRAIADTNKNGAVVPSNAARIQKFSILPVEFSIEGGELTPSMKLKRHVVSKMYNDCIDTIYESSETYVPFQK